MFPALFVEACLTMCIDQLGVDRFRTREAMHRQLEPISGEIVALLEAGTSHNSAEVAIRCRLLYASHAHDRAWTKAGTMHPKGWNKLPWIWLDESYHGPASDGCVKAARESGCKAGCWRDGWGDWRYATRLWLTNELLLKTRLHKLPGMLNAMADAEVVWMLDSLRYYGAFRMFPVRF